MQGVRPGFSVDRLASRLGSSVSRTVEGTVAAGFEPVRDVFEASFRAGREIGAGFCATRNGEVVVDLWGGLADRQTGRPWSADTPTVAFSTTKGMVALMFTMLAERNQIELDAPIARYWPAFAVNGKQDIRVRQLLNHRAGLSAIDQPLTLDDFAHPERVEEALIAQEPLWQPGQEQGYGATAFGAFGQALFRRVAGRTLGTYFADEVTGPLGVEAWLGMPEGRVSETATLYPYGRRTLFGRVIPTLLGRRNAEGRMFRRAVLRHRTTSGRALTNPTMGAGGFRRLNEPRYKTLELPWMNGIFTARALARIYGALANGGALDGVRLLSPESIAPVMRRQSWSERDRVLQKPLGFSQGFCKDELHLFSPNVEAFGHAGAGGSLGIADPRAGVSIGYVMNRLDWRLRSPRSVALCHALYDCLGTPF